MAVVEHSCQRCGATCLPEQTTCTSCGVSRKVTVPLPAEDILPPSTLHLTGYLYTSQLFRARYRIVRQVGVGGFGAVYEAEDTLEQRQVAIKEIGLAGLNSQQTIEATGSFNREVEMLSTLQHPGIPRLYEHLTDTEHWYLVMEFIPGETLETLLARTPGGRLPLERVLHISEQICDILHYLHNQQPTVIFRDLKPANIMLTSQDRLYLIDFGVARIYKPEKTHDTIAFGSPGYAAPEQYGRAQTTPRSDIYSLGALLHQLLTGTDPSLDPFHFRALRSCDRSLPSALEKLVTRMLAEDRETRPAGIEEVAHRLKAIAALQQRKTARQSQNTLSTTTTFSTIGVTVFIYRKHTCPVNALAWSPDGRALASCDNYWRVDIWDALGLAPARRGGVRPVSDLAWSPDGRALALGSIDHTVRLWYVDSHPRWWQMAAIGLGYLSDSYERHTSPVTALCWSPDGQMIASAEAKNAIHVWDARCKVCTLVYQGHGEAVKDIAWSPDGTRIASCSADQSVHAWRADNGEKRWKIHLPGVQALAWSPDSHYLACGGSEKAVHIWDIARNRLVYSYRAHRGAIRAVAWSPDGQRLASASADGTVHVWSSPHGQDAFVYRGHTESVITVAWSPDGHYLASADEEALVHVWKSI